MKNIIYILSIFLLNSTLFSKAAFVSLEEKVDESELIARIQILTISKNDKNGFKSKARVKIVDSIKGLVLGQEFVLEFDNGFACPNVIYQLDDDCIIFAKKMKNGNYSTFNSYFGRVNIKKGNDNNLMVSGSQFNSKSAISYSKAKEIIQSKIKKK